MVVCHPERSEGSVVNNLGNSAINFAVQRFLVALGMTSQRRN
jgi:hypothetical protein